jgi:hypothetical protein
MFRYVQLKIGRIELGEPLAQSIVDAMQIAPGSRTAELPTGTFGRADRITLHLSAADRLERIEFGYAADADFERMIGEYVSLGAPTREALQRGDVAIDLARWATADTELTLTREVDASGSRIRGELRDCSSGGQREFIGTGLADERQ